MEGGKSEEVWKAVRCRLAGTWNLKLNSCVEEGKTIRKSVSDRVLPPEVVWGVSLLVVENTAIVVP